MTAASPAAMSGPPVRGRAERFGWWLTGVVTLGVLARIAYLLTVGAHVPMGMDAAWYVVQGQGLAAGHGYDDPRVWLTTGGSVPTANFPPLWPIVLSIADRIGLDTTFRNQLVGIGIGSVTVAITGLLGRRTAGPAVGLVAAAVVAVSPSMIAADTSLMAEPLYVLCVVGAVLGIERAGRDPRVRIPVVAGVLVGLAAITRSDGLLLGPVLALVLGVAVHRTGRRVVTPLVAFGLAFAVPVALWSGYASSRMGGPVVATSNSGNMLTGSNCGSTWYGDLLGAWDERCASDFEPGDDELAWADRARTRAVDWVRAHPRRIPVVAGARALRVWGLWDPRPMSRLEAVETRDAGWQRLAWATDLAVLVAAVLGAVVARRRGIGLLPVVAVVGAVTVTAMVANGNPRFRLVAEPLLAVLAAVGAVAAAVRVAHRRGAWRRARGAGPPVTSDTVVDPA